MSLLQLIPLCGPSPLSRFFFQGQPRMINTRFLCSDTNSTLDNLNSNPIDAAPDGPGPFSSQEPDPCPKEKNVFSLLLKIESQLRAAARSEQQARNQQLKRRTKTPSRNTNS